MDIAGIIFYPLAGVIVAATVLAVTCRRAVHAALYFIISLLGLAMVFFLLGAPLLATLEVILYAGAIMMLILFVVMMVRTDNRDDTLSWAALWVVPAALTLVCGASLAALLVRWPQAGDLLPALSLSPAGFGQALFGSYWPAIELVSLVLFVALVGALFFGSRGTMTTAPGGEGEVEK